MALGALKLEASTPLVPEKSISASPRAASTVIATTISPPPSMGMRAEPSLSRPMARRTQASALSCTKPM